MQFIIYVTNPCRNCATLKLSDSSEIMKILHIILGNVSFPTPPLLKLSRSLNAQKFQKKRLKSTILAEHLAPKSCTIPPFQRCTNVKPAHEQTHHRKARRRAVQTNATRPAGRAAIMQSIPNRITGPLKLHKRPFAKQCNNIRRPFAPRSTRVRIKLRRARTSKYVIISSS